MAASRLASFASFAALAALACASPEPLPSNAPDDVRWLALVELGDAPSLSASALTRWDGPALPLFARDDADALLLGYTDPQIGAVSAGASPSAIASERLAPVAACAPALPAPTWAARWPAGGALEAASVADAPRLGASWVDASCVEPEELSIDRTCNDVRCVPVVEPKGCALDVDLTSCALGRTRAVAQGSALCVEPITAAACTAAPVPSHAAAAMTCSGPEGACTYTWYTARVPLPFSRRDLSLPRSGTWVPTRANVPGPVPPDALARGHAWALATLGRNALVSVPVGEPRDVCEPDVLGELLVVDGDRATVVTTATAPACLVQLAPGDGAVVGLFAEAGEWWLGTFGDDARLRARVPADPRPRGAPEPRPDVGSWVAVSLTRGPGGYTAVWRARFGSAGAVIHYDDRLAPVGRTHIPDLTPTGALELDAATTVLSTLDSGELVFSSRTGGVVRRTRLDARGGVPGITMYAATRRGTSLLVPVGTPPAVYEVSVSGNVLVEALVFDREVGPQRVLSPPDDPARTLVLGYLPDRSATLTEYLAAEGRFLPSTRVLGDSMAGAAEWDAAGRLWLLFAWSGQIAILELGG